jgi:ABC-2 type transport system permease protein
MAFDRRRCWAIVRKEVIQLRRDSRSLLLAFLLPVLLLILFGYAITWDIERIPTAVLDEDHSARSRELLDSFRAAGYFRVTRALASYREIEELLTRGEVWVALVIPPGFAADLDAGRSAPLQVIVDGSDANTATIVLAYAQSIVQSYASRVQLAGVRATAPLTAASRVWYNEDLRSRNMIVPGLVAVTMMIIAAMLTSLTIAREWERGTMEQLIATPVTRAEVVLGKMLPYVAIGLIDVLGCTLIGTGLFHVPLRGSLLLLMVLSFFFLTGALGLGMFISAATRSQLLATQLAMVTTFLPAYLLSGFMFSIDAMPRALQLITYLIPARYFLVVTRGIFLKGIGVPALYGQGLAMVAFAALGLLLAVRVFRKELR